MELAPRPRLVFVGAVSRVKVDIDLIAELARSRPDWSIILAGPVGLGDPRTDVSGLEQIENIHLIGHRPHRDLPAVLRGADVALIPYELNQLTASVFPMKVYEYLAAGLPVVSTPLPSLEGVEGVSFAADSTSMVSAIESLLASNNRAERRARSQLAEGHSWEDRIEEIELALGEL